MTRELEYQLWVDLACLDRKTDIGIGSLSSFISNAWKGGDAYRTSTTSWLLNITTYKLNYTKRNDTTTMNTLELINRIAGTVTPIALSLAVATLL